MPRNLGGHVSLVTLPFRKIFKGSCPDCPWKHAHQVRSLNRFKLVWWTGPLRTHRQKHRQTNIYYYLCHSLRLL